MAELPVHSRPDHATGVERLADRLEKPLLDRRSYRVIRLPNELEALLIHDADTDKASAAMDVNVGSFSDEEDLPGMAHAVEHLLFMGTEKYPGENDYNTYLTRFGGHSNAFTQGTDTNYYFELSATSTSNSPGSSTNNSKESLATSIPKCQAPLYGALDRFAQFFIKPLFLEDTVDRELKAVDSENKKNLQSDDWRQVQLNRSLCSKKHPFHKFATGNYTVLHDDPIKRGVNIREAFIGFYEQHYSANRMKLAVLGRESLDELEQWTQEIFADVPNQRLPQLRWDDLPVYGEEELGMQIFAKPVMDRRMLDLHFNYPDEEELYESQPSRYLGHLIGHEGPGSLLAYLKAKGWVTSLSAGGTNVCPGTSQFVTHMQLTEEGLMQYREIIKMFFQYVAMIKDEPPHKWIFEEMSKLQEIEFKFREQIPASRTTSWIAGVMQRPLPRDQLLSGQTLLRKFNPEAIKRGLKHLDPDNFCFTVVGRDLDRIGVTPDSKEQWYGTEYKMEKIPADFMAEVKKAASASAGERLKALHLPGKNEFLPQRLDVEKKDVAQPATHPALIRNTDAVRTWFKKDDQFWVPKAHIHVALRSPILDMTPRSRVIAMLYAELVTDSLSEYAYDAELAGLDYHIIGHADGFDVSVSGYNDKAAVLLEKVLVTMRDLEVKPERFDVIKEKSLRGYRNYEYSEPYRQVQQLSRWIMSERMWLVEQFVEELPTVTIDDLRVFFPQLLKQTHAELLVHGNMYKEDALRITDLVMSTFKPHKYPPEQWPIRRCIMPQSGEAYTYKRTLANKDNVNHCIDYHLHLPNQEVSYDARAKMLLWTQMVSEPVFDTLRTKQQLGYIVTSGPVLGPMLFSFRVLIQSEKDCDYLEERIEDWLVTYGQELEAMSEKEFQEHKVGIINKRLEKLKNLGQETGRFWFHITAEAFDFELVYTDVQHLEPLTKEDMLDFYRTYFHPEGLLRSKTAVHMVAQSSAEEIAAHTSPAEQREKLAATLADVLTQLGIAADAEKLIQALEKVDVTKGDTDSILAAIGGYLEDTAGVAAKQAEQIMGQGQAVLAQVLPQLGIKTGGSEPNGETAVNGTAETNGTMTKPKVKKSVIIEDAKAWKARHPLSTGPTPPKPLSAFEELEPKL